MQGMSQGHPMKLVCLAKNWPPNMFRPRVARISLWWRDKPNPRKWKCLLVLNKRLTTLKGVILEKRFATKLLHKELATKHIREKGHKNEIYQLKAIISQLKRTMLRKDHEATALKETVAKTREDQETLALDHANAKVIISHLKATVMQNQHEVNGQKRRFLSSKLPMHVSSLCPRKLMPSSIWGT